MFLTNLWYIVAGRPASDRPHAAGPGAMRQAVRPFGQHLGAVPGRGVRFLLCASVLLVLSLPVPGVAQPTTCTETSPAVNGHGTDLAGLVADCTVLLGAKDTLRGTASLNLGSRSRHLLVEGHYRPRNPTAGWPC